MKMRTIDEANAKLIQMQVTTHLKRGLTVADVATRTGLSFNDAESALYLLSRKYHSHLSVTNDGIIVFTFPWGFNRHFCLLEALSSRSRTQKKYSGSEEELSEHRKFLTILRINRGRVGWTDILRSTGLPRSECEEILAGLCARFDGKLELREDGVAIYAFSALRKTAQYSPERIRKKELAFAKECWTNRGQADPESVEKRRVLAFLFVFSLSVLLSLMQHPLLAAAVSVPYLGISIFGDAIKTRRKERRFRKRNGRLGLLKILFQELKRAESISETKLASGWHKFSSEQPTEKALRQEIIKLGGEAFVAKGNKLRYCFPEITQELKLLQSERLEAKIAEARLAKVVFSSKVADFALGSLAVRHGLNKELNATPNQRNADRKEYEGRQR